MARILVVDDQRNMRTTLSLMLRGAGHEVEEASDGEAACETLSQEAFDLVITDLRMGATDGMAVLRHAKETAPMTEVVVMTAFGTIESAVEAMRIGAHDYIQKPFMEEELLVKVQKAVEKRHLAGEVSFLAAEFRERYGFENIIGHSPPIREVLGRVVRIAPTDTTVLITGESGTGKELIARAIHANSQRASRPFISVNCAALSESLLESELFGHMRGAFTGAVATRKGLFEEADGGTFFFDEIAETPTTFQAKLLRAIQEGEVRRVGDNRLTHVDVRVVAATNQDLKEAIAAKAFREDLYYRLNVVRFALPPLRERREDIADLAQFFLDKYAKRMKREVSFGEGVLDYLTNYPYPGNIRELENLVQQGVALSVGGVMQLDDIAQDRAPVPAPAPGSKGTEPLQVVVDQAERRAIESVLREVNGNKEKAAEVLGLSTTTLWRKMKRLGVVWTGAESVQA